MPSRILLLLLCLQAAEARLPKERVQQNIYTYFQNITLCHNPLKAETHSAALTIISQLRQKWIATDISSLRPLNWSKPCLALS